MKMAMAIEIKELYKRCGVEYGRDCNVRKEIHLGNLNNVLNANFSSVYGKSVPNNFSNMTIVK